jgi:hypothetical protein
VSLLGKNYFQPCGLHSIHNLTTHSVTSCALHILQQHHGEDASTATCLQVHEGWLCDKPEHHVCLLPATVTAGVRQEAEKEAGVPDFLLLSSLAGGTGSGFGSALLEVLADEYPCSTIAAAAVAPGRGGGSDTATQSINCCLALQHLSQHARAVLLLDNQVLLDQLNSKLSSSSRGVTSRGGASGSTRSSSSTGLGSSSSARPGASGGPAAGSGRACLQGVNELAAQALLGLLWPVGGADQLAGRSNIRQLVGLVGVAP